MKKMLLLLIIIGIASTAYAGIPPFTTAPSPWTSTTNSIYAQSGQVSVSSQGTLQVSSVGNVGIGTTAPASKLSVVSNGNSSSTRALNVMDSTQTSLLAILDNGYTGIGTAAPDSALHLTSGANGSKQLPRLMFYQTGGFGNKRRMAVDIVQNTPGAENQLNVESYNDSLALQGTPLSIGFGGNVGVGTTQPTGQFQVGTNSLIIQGPLFTVGSNTFTINSTTGTTIINGTNTYTGTCGATAISTLTIKGGLITSCTGT